ncbi:MAG: N-acetyl-gamma-glutamyl-phosphate reductase [Gammaproteobacteria bacterium]|jgi:N-acetyl-gamma-glutamyl-phosphate reductase
MSEQKTVFIDGEAGTTGLQIAARLAGREDLRVAQIDPALRKDTAARRDALNACDIAILCLPDDAARESVALVDNPSTRIIDASTAHRVVSGWVYGFPEYAQSQRDAIRGSTRIANPGCYAIAAVAILRPLIAHGLLPAAWPVSINGMSGYSGGGKALIAAFEDPSSAGATDVVAYDYALGLEHKHVPEIVRWSGLENSPVFLPTVARYYKGMLVHVPLPLWAMPGQPSPAQVREVYAAYYAGEPGIRIAALEETARLAQLDPEACNDTNELRLHVLHDASGERAVVVAQLDNLGKGASGQVVQTINILLGVAEATGLKAV